MNNNVTATFSKFLKLLNADVTETTAREYIESHPDYPSMLSFEDALQSWNIETVSLKIYIDDYLNMPTPNIVYFRNNGGKFAVVKNITSKFIEWYDTESTWIKQPIEKFEKNWSGVTLIAELSQNSGEKDYLNRKKNELLQKLLAPLSIFFISLIFLFSSIYISIPLTTLTALILLLKSIGAIVATVLLFKSIDSNSELINKLCNAGKNISCQSILDSKVAKITSWLSLSDLGFVYFFSTLIALLLCSKSNSVLDQFLNLQLVLSGGGIVFSFFSVYYQGIIAKMWCPLCLITIVLFWAEFITLFNYSYLWSFNLDLLIPTVISILIPIVFLLIFKRTFTASKLTIKYKNELARIRNNPNILQSILNSQKEMPFLPQGIGTIMIGYENAPHTLTLVSNPLCTPCSRMHKQIEELLLMTKNIKYQIVFLSNTDDIDVGGLFVRKVLSLSKSQQHEAISSWVKRNDKNFEIWNEPYRHIKEKDIAKVWQLDQRDWALDAEVKSTPTIFFDGYLLPDFLKIEDLQYATNFTNIIVP